MAGKHGETAPKTTQKANTFGMSKAANVFFTQQQQTARRPECGEPNPEQSKQEVWDPEGWGGTGAWEFGGIPSNFVTIG